MALLKDQVALVTGGSKGIGKAMCRQFAEHRARIACVYGHDRRAAEAMDREFREQGCEGNVYQCDVMEPGQVSAMVDQVVKDFGRIHFISCELPERKEARPREIKVQVSYLGEGQDAGLPAARSGEAVFLDDLAGGDEHARGLPQAGRPFVSRVGVAAQKPKRAVESSGKEAHNAGGEESRGCNATTATACH
jgi:hypothetical protein